MTRTARLLLPLLTIAAAPPPPIPSHSAAEQVIVTATRRNAIGGGLIKPQTAAKSVSTIDSTFIRTQPAIQNAYQYIQLAPGAAVATADPFGLSTQFSINVHGLGQDELGYVLDGMPLNDIGFYTAYPSQFIDSENIDQVSLAQGSADLDSPVISAAGGLLTLSTVDPALHPGGSIDAAYGSYNTNREFIRLDTGLIGGSGVRAFISYSHTNSDQWRGPGAVKRQHIDYKLVREWGDGNRTALTGTWHDGITPNYVMPTLGDYRQNGTHDNYEAGFTPGDGNYWRLNTGTFRILYMSAPSHLTLADTISLDVTPYWQYGYGNAPFGEPLSETGNFQGTQGPYTVAIPNSDALGGVVMANYQDLQYRAGIVTKLTWTIGHNDLVLGDWYDYSDETDTQSFTGLSPHGVPGDIWADTTRGLLRLPDGRLLLAGADHVITQTNEPFAADILHLLDNHLKIEAGFKFAMISRDGTNNVPGPQYHANINTAEPLPRLAATWQITPRHQIFASATTNFRTASEATFFDAYYGGQIYAAANTGLKPEYSISEEVGYRYTDPLVTASLAAFNYNFTDRQIATIVGGNMISQSINAGGQTSRGIDIEAGTHPWHHLSPYISGEYLHATIDNNLQDGTTTLATRGKTAVRSPQFQGAFGLSYDDGTFFGTLAVKYVGREFATFVNDESIPSHTTMDVGIGARLPPIGQHASPELQLNLINLNNGSYLSGVASPTATAADQPTYYVAAGIAVIFTARQAF